MSRLVSRALIAATFGIPYGEVDDLPITVYQDLVGQAVNIGAYWATGHLEPQDVKSKKDVLRQQLAIFRKKGIIK